MTKRVKLMPEEQFKEVRKRGWHPVLLKGDAVPNWMQNIPRHRIDSIFASGTFLPGLSYSYETIPSGELIGGIDVYRNAPDDPVELNKDWYAVVVVSGTDSMLMVPGPFKDDEHWIDEIPQRLRGAEVLGIPKKPSW